MSVAYGANATSSDTTINSNAVTTVSYDGTSSEAASASMGGSTPEATSETDSTASQGASSNSLGYSISVNTTDSSVSFESSTDTYSETTDTAGPSQALSSTLLTSKSASVSTFDSSSGTLLSQSAAESSSYSSSVLTNSTVLAAMKTSKTTKTTAGKTTTKKTHSATTHSSTMDSATADSATTTVDQSSETQHSATEETESSTDDSSSDYTAAYWATTTTTTGTTLFTGSLTQVYVVTDADTTFTTGVPHFVTTSIAVGSTASLAPMTTDLDSFKAAHYGYLPDALKHAHRLSSGSIAGIAVGSVLAVLLASIALIMLRRKRKNSYKCDYGTFSVDRKHEYVPKEKEYGSAATTTGGSGLGAGVGAGAGADSGLGAGVGTGSQAVRAVPFKESPQRTMNVLYEESGSSQTSQSELMSSSGATHDAAGAGAFSAFGTPRSANSNVPTRYDTLSSNITSFRNSVQGAAASKVAPPPPRPRKNFSVSKTKTGEVADTLSSVMFEDGRIRSKQADQSYGGVFGSGAHSLASSSEYSSDDIDTDDLSSGSGRLSNL